tara:strand:+ start:644 stop:820 length:177 start_codon:yes stop_codon:yes gene_type:complete
LLSRNFFERKTSELKETDEEVEHHHGGSIILVNDKRSRANAGRATGSFGVSTGATNSR